MRNRKQTSQRIAGLAGKTLGDPRASKQSKALAGSALAQAGSHSRSKPKAVAGAG
jgi:hypothetical protein